MSAPYDPSLLSVAETIEAPETPSLALQVYRYADGPYRARLVRLGAKEPRKIDAFGVDELRALAALAARGVTALKARSAPPPAPVPTVDPRVAILEAELAALRAKMVPTVPPAVPAQVPAPAPTPIPAPARAPASKRPRPSIEDASRTESAVGSVAAARAALGV